MESIIVLICISLIVVVLGIIIHHWMTQKEINTRKDKLFQALDEKYANGLIQTKEDVIIVLSSIYRNSYSEYPLVSVLEDYITERIGYIKRIDKEETKKKYDVFKKILDIENRERPFKNAPDEERRLLANLNEEMKNEDMDSLESNLNELYSVIVTRNKIYLKQEKGTKRANIVSTIGLTLTIVFGITSIYFAILQMKTVSANKEQTKSESIVQNQQPDENISSGSSE